MKAVTVFFAAVLIILGMALLLAFPTMWLWDYLMPTLFGLKTITLCAAFCSSPASNRDCR